MELLVAIGIMAAIAAVTIPLVTKFVDRGQSGAQSEVNGVAADLIEYMRMTNGKTTYYYCWNTAAVASVHTGAVACP